MGCGILETQISLGVPYLSIVFDLLYASFLNPYKLKLSIIEQVNQIFGTVIGPCGLAWDHWAGVMDWTVLKLGQMPCVS